MTSEGSSHFHWLRKLMLMGLLVCVVGLPVNDIVWYFVLLVAAILIAVGRVRTRPAAWGGACLLLIAALTLQAFLSPPKIEEGHNAFLVDEREKALIDALPPEFYRIMAAEFDKAYPPERRCRPDTVGCWRRGGFPDRAYAFSADGLYHRGASRGAQAGDFSRLVNGIDFTDPVWLRLGFTNELRYNWISSDSDIRRLRRDRRIFSGLQNWHLMMPYFVMYRFPAAFAGGQLCWEGSVIWEERPDRPVLLTNTSWACRQIEASDIGNRIVGLGIRPDTLAMSLDPPITVLLWQAAYGLGKFGIMIATIGLLLRWQRSPALTSILVGLGVTVVALHDVTMLGGWRPLDGGDDGLFYESVGRDIAQNLATGNVLAALRGGEDVFYFGGPGLRYLRALERLIFGDTNFGYLAALLLMPGILLALYRRFLPGRLAIALALIFIAVPVGMMFGTSFLNYVRWAARGFADPAAAIAALSAVLLLVGRTREGPDARFGPAMAAGLLFALAIFIRPNLAPFCAVMLTGAGLAGLMQRQWMRIAGLCIGFLPFTAMPLHNWYFGNVFVLFSTNSAHPLTYVMPPAAWLSAFGEMVRLDFGGEHVLRGMHQILDWLAGPTELWLFAPLHAAAVAVALHVAWRGKRYDPWLRLIAAAALAQHSVALFYIATPRYHFFTWLMTGLAVMAWLHREGFPAWRRRWPHAWLRWRLHPVRLAVRGGLRRLERSGFAQTA